MDREQRLAVEEATKSLLAQLDPDPGREGLADTPARVAGAWAELLAGYRMDPAEILSKTFDVGGRYDQMVVVGPVDFHSTCEHHLLPFLGEAWVAYVPKKGGRVVGLSKLPRLVDCFALRLQVQERLTQQVADEVSRHLEPVGWGVLVRARHLCMALRGAQKPGALMTTTALGGAIREDPAARSEFLACCST